MTPSIPTYILGPAVDLLVQSGARATLPVTGGSMRPLLRAGDQVVVVFGAGEPQPGDVMLFRQNGSLTAHRLLARQKAHGQASYTTRGDSAGAPDPPVPADDLLGRAVAVQRDGREISLETPQARLLGRLALWRARSRAIDRWRTVRRGWNLIFRALMRVVLCKV